ncbi:MAG: hydrogenase maturation protease [Desulfotomaculales bacterium]
MVGGAEYRVLVLGLGNLYRADDGLGVRVVRELGGRKWPPGAFLLEAGTAVLDCLEEISRSRFVVAVDAVRGGGRPGTVYRFTVEELGFPEQTWCDAHSFFLPGVVALARKMTGLPQSVVIYGVEPADLSLGDRLSAPVRKVFSRVVQLVSREINRFLA